MSSRRAPSRRTSSRVRQFSLTRKIASANKYRDILFTNTLQLIVQVLKPGQVVEREVHKHADQFIRVEKGSLTVLIYASKSAVKPKQTLKLSSREEDTIVIPKGTWHELQNESSGIVKLYTIYGPPVH